MAAESQGDSGGISSYTAGVLSKHVVRLGQTETNIPYDLITFLSAAQWRSVDFLPITWHPALDTARGFTARVHQSLISTSFTFAFKRYRFPERDKEISSTYKSLISEVCILGHPIIRQNDHILRLEGACWDPFTTPDDIFPVLVFERTRHGNLADFMLSNHGKLLSMHDRLVLCTHLIKAIETLHSCSKIIRLINISKCHIKTVYLDIVHGDIKPENILIFEDENGNCISKVCDFGFSTMCDGESIIQLPSTQPWTAPDYQTTIDLRKTDRTRPSLTPGLHEENRDSRYDWIKSVKFDTCRRAAVLTGITDATSLDQNEKSGLFEFFRITLDEKSESRVHDLASIKNILCAEASLVGAISNLSLMEGFDRYFRYKYFDVSREPHWMCKDLLASAVEEYPGSYGYQLSSTRRDLQIPQTSCCKLFLVLRPGKFCLSTVQSNRLRNQAERGRRTNVPRCKRQGTA